MPYEDSIPSPSKKEKGLRAVDWRARGSMPRRTRPVLDLMYPRTLEVDWGNSVMIFRRPVVTPAGFIHAAPQWVLKWVARVRAGCLPARARLCRHKMEESAACPCCEAPVEDDEHLLFGCPATGTADWLALLQEAWAASAAELRVEVAMPAMEWLRAHRWQLVAAILPASVASEAALPPTKLVQFCRRLHLKLALQTAERLRRRQVLIATAGGATDASGSARPPRGPGQPRPCPFPVERQLSPRAPRAVEVRRRTAQLAADSASSSTASAPVAAPLRVPVAGKQRSCWLKARLVRFLQADTNVCAVLDGSTAETLVACFERLTGEAFTDSPGAAVTSRVRRMAKVMGNLTTELQLDPPLLAAMWGSLRVWNRKPKVSMDVERWRRAEAAREATATPAARNCVVMAGVNAELGAWLWATPYLRAVKVETGEITMALLILWEVEHGQLFSAGVNGDNRTALAASFGRRLQVQVQKDDELQGWVKTREMQCAVQAGVPAVHQLRWSVQVVRPAAGDPKGFYNEFVLRWRAY